MASMDGSSVTKGKAGSIAKREGRAEERTPAKGAIRHAVRRYLCVQPPLVRKKGRRE